MKQKDWIFVLSMNWTNEDEYVLEKGQHACLRSDDFAMESSEKLAMKKKKKEGGGGKLTKTRIHNIRVKSTRNPYRVHIIARSTNRLFVRPRLTRQQATIKFRRFRREDHATIFNFHPLAIQWSWPCDGVQDIRKLRHGNRRQRFTILRTNAVGGVPSSGSEFALQHLLLLIGVTGAIG